MKTQTFLSRASLLSAYVCASSALALPIGYGYNQGDLKFNELKSDHFLVYYDDRTPTDGKLALRSLEAARPHLERWFQRKRSSPLIVNMSAESENASFANFITDSIELQTQGQGSRDLAWHEFTHAMMYQHMDNIFGPAGALLHLPWMEAWFLEGLAEAVSVSITSEQQAGVERFHALQNAWPTWDRLHSLYTGSFSYRGYATSGAFVAWILRTYGAEKLADALQTFRSDSMPWWWPWALTPFNDFWPMDTMLRKWTGHSGQKLYEIYKADATKFWTSRQPSKTISTKSEKQLRLSSAMSTVSLHGKPYALQNDSGKTYLVSLGSDKTHVVTDWGSEKMPVANTSEIYGQHVAIDGNTIVYAIDHWPSSREQRMAVVMKSGQKKARLNLSSNWIQKLWLSKSSVWWLETRVDITRLCSTPRGSFPKGKIACALSAKTPVQLAALGSEDLEGHTTAKEIWINRMTQTMTGNRNEVLHINAESGKLTSFAWNLGGHPHAIAFSKKGLWFLASDHSQRYLRRYAGDGSCVQSIPLSDMTVKLLNSDLDRPWAVNWVGDLYSLAVPSHDIDDESCNSLRGHTSPLLAAVQSKTDIAFNDAVKQSSIWSSEPMKEDEAPSKLDAAQSENGVTAAKEVEGKPSSWRGRPIFVFPWLGADDALGFQLGIVSVPLMDHLQNETVRATALVGLYSRFPYQELSLVETRWTPTWTFSAYRAQAYNGRYLETDEEIYSSFIDQKGLRADGSLFQRWKSMEVLWSWGLNGAHLAPYIGKATHFGNLKEVYAGAGIGWKFGDSWRYTIASQNRAAPKTLNEEFDYTVNGLSTSIIRDVGLGSLEFGIEGEKTRGPYRRDLQELYTPLKTFIPGSGGGYNKNSYAFTADQGLFTPIFGDTQGRAKLNFTHPIIPDVDKFSGLVYIDRLDFSAFLNHGGAWRGDEVPKGSLLSAQGYNVDLLMDNKGVRFNIGAGAGQVLGNPWQLYTTAGFDAIF